MSSPSENPQPLKGSPPMEDEGEKAQPGSRDRESQRPDHPTPSKGTVFRAQVALLLARPRLGISIGLGYLLFQALLLAAAGVLIGLQIEVSGDHAVVSTPRVGSMGVDEGLAAWAWAAGAMLLMGWFFTARVWRDCRGRQRHYHWSLPMDRRVHDLLRVAAGSAALAVICVAFLLATVLTAVVFGNGGELHRFLPTAGVAAILGPQVLYLLVSAVDLASHGRRGKWFLLLAAAFGVLHIFFGALGGESFILALSQVFWGPFGLVTAVAGPTLTVLLEGKAEVPGPWLPAFTLWAFFALAAVTATAGGIRGRER